MLLQKKVNKCGEKLKDIPAQPCKSLLLVTLAWLVMESCVTDYPGEMNKSIV